ncbi:hypothetical protein C369_07384 [Cryptococcus neoformans A5-35-17]|nr:hypothetical protein C369_07384 [Cryptococcus neoformans var. grubii A5-35-17]
MHPKISDVEARVLEALHARILTFTNPVCMRSPNQEFHPASWKQTYDAVALVLSYSYDKKKV